MRIGHNSMYEYSKDERCFRAPVVPEGTRVGERFSVSQCNRPHSVRSMGKIT